MIDTKIENVFPLKKSGSYVPKVRGNKSPSDCTFYRWAGRGIRGVRLETVRIGGTVCTSAEALSRFFAACSGETRAPSNSRRRQQEIDAAEKELEAAGVV